MLFALGVHRAPFVNRRADRPYSSAMSVVDVPLSNTMFVVAHFHMVMGVAPILTDLRRDLPLVSQRSPGACSTIRWAKLHFWLTFLGAYADLLPDALPRA
jgi:heme/copper-type cytochrome/quinol oxidase subunit 1